MVLALLLAIAGRHGRPKEGKGGPLHPRSVQVLLFTTMYLMYHLDENNNRIYSLKV